MQRCIDLAMFWVVRMDGNTRIFKDYSRKGVEKLWNESGCGLPLSINSLEFKNLLTEGCCRLMPKLTF